MRRAHLGVRRFSQGRRGLTLVELMVTVVLLSIGLVGVASMFMYGYKTQLHAHFASVATDLATKKMERVRAVGYNGIDTTMFPPTFPVSELPGGAGAMTFQPYPDAASSNQYLVSVIVRWEGGAGVAGRIVLSSVISNHS